MTKSKKVVKKKARLQHQSQHRRTLADPKVAEMVVDLRLHWAGIGPVERGDRLRELTALGCSTRGLEKELKQSATSIRRHMALAELPERDREAVESGASAKKILGRKADADRSRRQVQRVIEDGETGALSDDLANIILESCRTKDWPHRAPVSRDSAQQFFNETLRSLLGFEANGNRAVTISRKLGLKKVLSKTRPRKEKAEFLMAFQAEWLANLVWAKAPERPIWDSAIQKAERRYKELSPQRRPIEIWQDNQRRLLEISTPPFRRPDQGARSLERQGGTPRPPKPH
jgi:hypothetical protein